jgi:hypothetical protein
MTVPVGRHFDPTCSKSPLQSILHEVDHGVLVDLAVEEVPWMPVQKSSSPSAISPASRRHLEVG